jgi:hypothetical protein
MRSHVRFSLLALVCSALVAALVPAAALAAEVPAIEKLVATNCEKEKCGQENVLGPFNEPKAAITVKEAEEEGFTQAGGRVPFGVTDFKILTTGSYPDKVPTSLVTHLRTDVAPGLATNPFAVTQCSLANFGTTETSPGSGVFPAPKCAGSEIGVNEVTVWLGPEANTDAPLKGIVYNLEPENGLASEFGVALNLQPILGVEVFAHTLIKGNVEWGRQANGTNVGDYHDYFEIAVSPKLPLIRSRLAFKGQSGTGDFITNATSCPGHNTTTLKETDLEGTTVKKEFTTPIGLSGCGSLAFEPSFALTPETTQSDQPDPFTAAASESHNPKANDQSQVKSASFTLPEGMTLNPSAAHGLEACTPKQAHQEGTVFGPQFGVECPAGSKIGTVNLNVPTLPNGSLTGSVYLGGPESGPITGPPYIMYVVANSEKFGVSVRLIGEVVPNEATGQVTTFFRSPPEQPFSELAIKFERGVLAPVANPLLCGTPAGSTSFEPTSAPGTARTVAFGVPVTGCAATIPFAPTQGTADLPATGGAHAAFTFNLERPSDGQQYMTKVSTVLPPGLIGLIPSVEQCTEAKASSASCPAGSQIGTVTTLAGAGPTPYEFAGKAYLTGPYKGAPFGMAFVVPTVAGPFNLGPAIARATINVQPISGRVVATSELPTIVHGGIPVRLKRIGVSINRPGFLVNPTNCGALATNSTVNGIFGGQQTLSTPFQVEKCSALAFKPSFKASVSAKTSKANGASLETTINQAPGQANIKSVLVTLPISLPSRLTTLQKACPEATFAANPLSCPSGSFVGGVRANTPALKDKMKGPAILVSHGGAAFPDLDLVLEADGVRIILVGNTDIKKGITTTNFAATPDAPVSSITVNLPTGPHSALAAHGDLCTVRLAMPTTITAQNGAVLKQTTKVGVTGCGVRIVGHKVIGNTAYLTVRTFSGGRISGSGSGLATVFRHLRGASNATTLKVPLQRGAHGHRNVRLRVGFVPSNRKLGSSAAFVTVFFP